MEMNDGDFSNFQTKKLFVRLSLHLAYCRCQITERKKREKKKEREERILIIADLNEISN